MTTIPTLRHGAAAMAAASLLVLGAGRESLAELSERPFNVLLAIADDWSYGHAGVYGCQWVDTPSFDRIAREGMLFTRAYTPNAKCAPSRACLLTGRNPWRLKAAVNHFPFFPVEFRTYPEALAAAGYTVGFTGKGWAPGVANDANGRARQLTGPRYAGRTFPPPAKQIAGNDYAANFADFLDAANGRPWCFWYGAEEPHRAYEKGVGARLAGKRTDQIDRVPAYWPDTEVTRGDMLDYAFEVEHFDTHLGKMLAELEEHGELDRTLLIVSSDHGMPFPRCKGQAYDASNHVPLAIRCPQLVARDRRTFDGLVSLIDIAPTLLDAVGIRWADSGMAAPDGVSLIDVLSGAEGAHRDHVLIGKERHDIGRPGDAGYPIRGIVTERWLYVRNHAPDRWPAGNPETGYLNCDGGPTKTAILDGHSDRSTFDSWALCFGRRPAEELYDLSGDSDCVENLANRSSVSDLKATLANTMRRELEAQRDPRARGAGQTLESYPYSDPRNRDYHAKWLRGEVGVASWVSPGDYRPDQNSGLGAGAAARAVSP